MRRGVKLDHYRQVAELDEVVPLARIEDNPDNDAAVVGVIQRADDDRVGEGVGREINRALCGRNERRIDRVEALLGREVDLLAQTARNSSRP